MAKKKLLTIDDLVEFCANNNLSRFSATDSGYQLCVQMPATYDSSESHSDDSFLFGKVKLIHTGRNRNGSSVTEEAAKKCLDTIKYKPFLANFTQDQDGNWDFTSHDVEYNEDGTIEYLEHQIGCFTADQPYIEHDDENDKDYVFAYVAIPRTYTHAAEIIERKGGTKVSAEIAVNEMSYSAADKVLVLEDIEIMGVTALGIHEDGSEVSEGMQGARLDIADFSMENNSIHFAQKDIDIISEFMATLKQYIEESKKGGDEMGQEVNEVVTPEETPEVEELQQEEVEQVEETVDEIPEAEEAEEPVEESDPESVDFSITVETFAVSLSEQLYALTQLVNDTYAEADNAYYSCDAYTDTKEVVFVDYYSGRAWRQKYQVRNDQYSLKGDRVEVHARYLTADEEAALDSMKSKYEEISTKLEKYEAEPQKLEIFASDDYKDIRNNEEFKQLQEQENHFDLSVEEVSARCDQILLNAAKGHTVEFSHKDTSFKPLPKKNMKQGRYGNLFKR